MSETDKRVTQVADNRRQYSGTYNKKSQPRVATSAKPVTGLKMGLVWTRIRRPS